MNPPYLAGSYLVLELTNQCNLACVHCAVSEPQHLHHQEKGFFSLPMALALFRDLAEVGARVLKRGLGRIHLVVRTEDAANGPMRFHISIFIRGAKAVYVAKIGRKYRAGERVAFRGEVASRGVGPGGEPEWEVKKASIAVDVGPWEEGAGEGGRVRSVYPAKAPLKPEQFGELTAAALEALRAKTTDATTGQEVRFPFRGRWVGGPY